MANRPNRADPMHEATNATPHAREPISECVRERHRGNGAAFKTRQTPASGLLVAEYKLGVDRWAVMG